MEIRGLGSDSPIYIPTGHKWLEAQDNAIKDDGTLVLLCVDCESVLALSFKRERPKSKGEWICSIQRTDTCCDESV